MPKKNWIDFKELRGTLDFGEVLRAYGVELKVKNEEQLGGFCPLPGHGGNKKSESFSVNVKRKIFNCFGCGQSGNIIEFAALMEGRDPRDGTQFRETAKELQERFGQRGEEPRVKRAESREESIPESPGSVVKEEVCDEGPEETAPVVVNAPLDFELKKLDPDHEYLRKRGFLRDTIEHFGAGYCARGLMKGRIAIPIRSDEGHLLGYAGRLVDDAAVSGDNPKYRFPGKREHDGKIHQFRKSEILYCSQEIWSEPPMTEVIVVEGFTDVWWLWQNGFENVVGLLGSSCSERQASLISLYTHRAGSVWIMTDGDDAGRRCAVSALERIAPMRGCRWIQLEDGKDPTDYSQSELCEMLPQR